MQRSKAWGPLNGRCSSCESCREHRPWQCTTPGWTLRLKAVTIDSRARGPKGRAITGTEMHAGGHSARGTARGLLQWGV